LAGFLASNVSSLEGFYATESPMHIITASVSATTVAVLLLALIWPTLTSIKDLIVGKLKKKFRAPETVELQFMVDDLVLDNNNNNNTTATETMETEMTETRTTRATHAQMPISDEMNEKKVMNEDERKYDRQPKSSSAYSLVASSSNSPSPSSTSPSPNNNNSDSNENSLALSQVIVVQTQADNSSLV
jgi:hypothetical protein